MKKFFAKNLYLIICTMILITIVYYGFVTYEEEIFTVCVESEFGMEEVLLYEAEDGNYYVFLPSYCELSNVYLEVKTTKSVKIDDELMKDGDSLAWIELNKNYSLLIDNQTYQIQFLKSANVATMYIRTVNGNMERVNEDKTNKETVAVVLYGNDGTLNYVNPTCTINSRGNGTWWYDKKSYLLTLSQNGELLGMSSATKWVLLANATDESNLRNKLVYDLASKVGLEWTPDCKYVDVYLDGVYHGLYLLTEKVESGDGRLDINTESGDFLCKIDLVDRWDTLQNPFSTKYGRTVEICNPDIVTLAEKQRIELLINQLEQAILSEKAIDILTNIDLDSWVRRYLIDEISGNIDSDVASSYFYYRDNRFYGGPIWDYDMTFGSSVRNEDPCILMAKNTSKASNLKTPYYDALYDNMFFHNRMVELYQVEFLPLLEQIMNTDIRKLADEIASATQMNSKRWSVMFQELYATGVKERTVDDMIQYLGARVKFLNEVWIEGRQRNETIMETEELVDESQLVTEMASQEANVTSNITTRDIVTGVSLTVFLCMFLCMVIMDIRQRKMERSMQK